MEQLVGDSVSQSFILIYLSGLAFLLYGCVSTAAVSCVQIHNSHVLGFHLCRMFLILWDMFDDCSDSSLRLSLIITFFSSSLILKNKCREFNTTISITDKT